MCQKTHAILAHLYCEHHLWAPANRDSGTSEGGKQVLPNRSTQKVKESASASTQNWIKKLTEGGRGVKSQDFPDGHAELKKKTQNQKQNNSKKQES